MFPSRTDNKPNAPGRAHSAALQLLAAGCAALSLIILGIGTVVSSVHGTPDVFTVAPISSLSLILLICIGAAGRWIPLTALRTLSGVAAAIGVVGVMQPAAVRLPDTGLIGGPAWIATASAAVVLATLIAAGLWSAWGVLIVCTMSTALARSTQGALSLDAWADLAQTFLGGIVLGFVCFQVIELSRGLDAAARAATIAGERAAQERGRLSARTETAAVVHDEILTTLTFAGSTETAGSAHLAQQARAALNAIERLTALHPAEVERALHKLGATVTERFPDSTFEWRREADAHLPQDVPPPLLQAMHTAVIQALHNTAQHAGAHAHSRVEIVTHTESLRIAVRDTGVGFDLWRVAPDRLGLRTSITQRVRDAGGNVTIDSAPGAGTTVTLTWHSAPSTSLSAPRTEPQTTAQFAVVAASFVFTQLALAVYSATLFASWWAPLAAIGVLFATSEVLRMSPFGPPSRRVTLFTVGASVGCVFLSAAVSPLSYGAQWAVVGAAFVLTTLAFRDRWRSAAAGGVLIAIAFTLVAGFRGAPAEVITLIDLRVLVVTFVSAGLSAAVQLVQRRTAEQYQRGARAAERAAWDTAARREIEHRGAQLRALLGPLLTHIASGGALTAAQQHDCAQYAGRLRDQIRAGALDREPLRSAAEHARARAVDVLMLDDRGGDLPRNVITVLPVIADHIALARTQAVVRILPEGRSSVITCVIDGAPVRLPLEIAENHQN